MAVSQEGMSETSPSLVPPQIGPLHPVLTPQQGQDQPQQTCVGIASPTTVTLSNSDGDSRASVSPLPATNFGQSTSLRGVDTVANVSKRVNASNDSSGHSASKSDVRPAAEAGDIFLNASMQLLHVNGDARQRVRQLWTSVQRLGRENQIGEAGMDLLYDQLGNILKSLSAEKLEGSKPLKCGQLILLPSAASDTGSNISGGSAVKAIFGSRPSSQLMRCSLFEDQSKFEMMPVRQDTPPASIGGILGTGGSSPPSRFALPTTSSLIGMLSDAFQEEPTARVIRLQGCQVRRLVPKPPSTDATGVSDVATLTKKLRRFQLLVPYKTQAGGFGDGTRVDSLFPTAAPLPYESLIFEIPLPASPTVEAEANADADVEEWLNALDHVCRFHLHRLEHALREAPTIERYREALQRYFPVCVPLTWLHNRSDQQTQQRRSSVNLSMIQIVKDLGRDKVLMDDRLFSAENSLTGSTLDQSDCIDSDSVSEVVKYMVKKILNFEQAVNLHQKAPTDEASAPMHQPLSPVHRFFAKNSEARALAFVERVLQGSSRTQSGGDIYDAISFFCQQEQVSICPVSHEAHPVQIRLRDDVAKNEFLVEVQVCMRFKVIELTPRSPTAGPNATHPSSYTTDLAEDNPADTCNFCEWAMLEGTLSRHFTLGQLSASGTVIIDYLSDRS